MKNILSTLFDAGIEEKQAKVYLACLELGQATVQELSHKSGVKRTSIYNFLEEMKARGLVSEIRRGKKVILIPENPNNLKSKAEQVAHSLGDVVPELMSIFNTPGNKPKISYYEGIAGLKKIYEDTLKVQQPIYGFADAEEMMKVMRPEYMWKYADKRSALGIDYSVIVKKGVWAEEAIKRNKSQRRYTKTVENVKFATEIDIYGDKVGIYSFRVPYAGVIIEDKAIAQTMMSIWRLLWGLLK
jgi:HTH-type transcriptional regulator, sugar sensing transcriptional regulator